MREESVVLEIHGTKAVVEMKTAGRRGGCCACATLPAECRRIEAMTSLPVEVGQSVLVEVPASQPALRALLVFALPLLGLIGGVVLGQSWQPLGLAKDSASIVIGFGSLLVVFAAAALADRCLLGRPRRPPTIVGVLGSAPLHEEGASRQTQSGAARA